MYMERDGRGDLQREPLQTTGRRSPKSSIRELEIQESHGCDSVLTHRPEKTGFQETVGGRELVLLRVSEPEVLETGEN